MIKYINDVQELNHMRFSERDMDSSEFSVAVEVLYNTYVREGRAIPFTSIVMIYYYSEIVEPEYPELEYEDIDLDDIVDNYIYSVESKRRFCEYFGLNYGKIGDLYYLGLPTVEQAQSYLDVINLLPVKNS